MTPFPVPALACDCHMHIFGDPARYQPAAWRAYDPVEMPLARYNAEAARMGFGRVVFVQPSAYGADNACMLDAVAQFEGQARGIAVVDPDVDSATLRALDPGGVRGLRFSVWKASDTVMTVDMIEGLARRIADLGWHVQLHMSGEQIVANASLLARLPCGIVFDHMARLPPDQGPRHPAWKVVQGLIDKRLNQ